MQPKPVDGCLNRDILGKILSHARESMVEEVNKMTFPTIKESQVITLLQARKFFKTRQFIHCYESDCNSIWCENEIEPLDAYETCQRCQAYMCIDHSYMIVIYSQDDGVTKKVTQYCAVCVPSACAQCGDKYVWEEDRFSEHACAN